MHKKVPTSKTLNIFFSILFCFLLLCWVGGTLQHLQKFLQYIKDIILELTPMGEEE
jgi:hypothetical protein